MVYISIYTNRPSDLQFRDSYMLLEETTEEGKGDSRTRAGRVKRPSAVYMCAAFFVSFATRVQISALMDAITASMMILGYTAKFILVDRLYIAAASLRDGRDTVYITQFFTRKLISNPESQLYA